MPTLDKAGARREARAALEGLTPTQLQSASEAVRNRVLQLAEVRRARSVFLYASTGWEVETYTLLEDLRVMDKTVAVPRIVDADAGRMEALVVRSPKDLAPGAYGLLEPRGRTPLVGPPDVTLLPALAVDPDTGVRLGRGGGFYDRYLAAHPTTLPIALVLERQLQRGLPVEDHDVPVAMVVTNKRVIRVAAD